MGAILRTVSNKVPGRSPERVELAKAIERHKLASEKFNAIRNAKESSWRPRAAAQKALDDAKAKVEEAKAAWRGGETPSA